MTRKLLQQALEAMLGPVYGAPVFGKPIQAAIKAIRAELAKPEQEPVARVNNEGFIVECGELLLAPGVLLYTQPAPTKETP